MSMVFRLSDELHVGKTQAQLKKLVKMVKLAGTFNCCEHKHCVGRKNLIKHAYGSVVHETYKVDDSCEPSVSFFKLTWNAVPISHSFHRMSLTLLRCR